MNTQSVRDRLSSQSYIESEMIEAALFFWFNNKEHIRSPFPDYIRTNLETDAIHLFLDWSEKLTDKAKKEINDDILAEKFEEILFETAIKMVMTEDEKLTIRYPFMVRIGDLIKDTSNLETESQIIDRWYFKNGDIAIMKVKTKNTTTGEIKESEFELPE